MTKKRRSSRTDIERGDDAMILRRALWLILCSAALVGCTPEDMGAKIQRECASVVAAAREAENAGVSAVALDAELIERGVAIPKYPGSDELKGSQDEEWKK